MDLKVKGITAEADLNLVFIRLKIRIKLKPKPKPKREASTNLTVQGEVYVLRHQSCQVP